MLQLIQFY